MPRIYEPHDQHRDGKLVLDQQSSKHLVQVYYVPSLEALEQANLSPEKASEYRVKLLELDVREGRLTIFPITTLGTHANFLKPKYSQIERITLDDAKPVLSPLDEDAPSDNQYSRTVTFGSTESLTEQVEQSSILDAPTTIDQIVEILEELPSGFIKDYDYGLGLRKPYRFIIQVVEELSECTEILISSLLATEVDSDNDRFIISTPDFEKMLKSLGSVTSLGRAAVASVKLAEAHNFLAERIGEPQIPVRAGKHPLRKLITSSIQDGGKRLPDDQQSELIGVVARNVKSLVATQPETIATLKNDIELVSLEVLIDRYEKMMAARLNEVKWQEFLDANPFMLGLVFGYPILKVQEKASVGGRKLSGRGDTFTDFLVKNSLTDNTAVVEIKTPDTKLLNDKEYRRGVFTPSPKLSGAVNQALDQKYKFEREISQFKENSGIYDIKSYAVHCCLIVGAMPDTDDQKKSFELYRGNSKDVEIITFDELLQKLKNLRDFLKNPERKEHHTVDVDEGPF